MRLIQHPIKIRVNIVPCSYGHYPNIWDSATGKTIATLDPRIDGYKPTKENAKRQAGLWLKGYNKIRTRL